jgi:hypothetical protein
MANFNGSDMGWAVLLRDIGELRAEARNQTQRTGQVLQAIERQNDILIDLPSRIAATISPASANPSPKPRILPELSELIRALYPVLILCAAVLGKSTWPTALPLLRAALEAAIHGGG